METGFALPRQRLSVAAVLTRPAGDAGCAARCRRACRGTRCGRWSPRRRCRTARRSAAPTGQHGGTARRSTAPVCRRTGARGRRTVPSRRQAGTTRVAQAGSMLAAAHGDGALGAHGDQRVGAVGAVAEERGPVDVAPPRRGRRLGTPAMAPNTTRSGRPGLSDVKPRVGASGVEVAVEVPGRVLGATGGVACRERRLRSVARPTVAIGRCQTRRGRRRAGDDSLRRGRRRSW
jgi:hypothetical protein